MDAESRRRQEAALSWVRRIADPTFDGWDDHLAWLERDPHNSTAFDRALLLIEHASDGLTPPSPCDNDG